MRRDGTSAEVVFPNTVPPFFPSFVLFARPPEPEEYEHRLAGIRAHNRWLADWCGESPSAGPASARSSSTTSTTPSTTSKWIKEHGLRGGVLMPTSRPTSTGSSRSTTRSTTRLWKVCEDLGVPVNAHGGTGAPDYGNYPVVDAALHHRGGLLLPAPVRAVHAVGRVRALPELKFVMTEMGCAWLPPMLERLDRTLAQIRKTGRTGELRYSDGARPAAVGDGVLPAELLGRRQPARPG